MCGIAGALMLGEDDLSLEALGDVQKALISRGPDGDGMWVSHDEKVALTHRRLSIIDLSDKAAQPMSDSEGRYQIVFNGEIYNYKELKENLKNKGYSFISESDTEVLVNAYDYYGENITDHIRGMFSFAIWDLRKEELFLCRDPLGIKPLYYSKNKQRLIFSSQVKSLILYDKNAPSKSYAGTVGFFLWGNIPEPYTIYNGVYSLQPGCFLRIKKNGELHEKKYFDLRKTLIDINPSEARPPLKQVLHDSIRMHQVSDVPVGMFLSSGIDSAAICGLASASSGELRAITLGFSEYHKTHDDEVPLAKVLADHYQVPHEASYVNNDTFLAEKGRILEKMDQPTIDGINTYFVSRAASNSGMKVALSGIGGDEWFGGYDTFKSVPKIYSRISKFPLFERIGPIFRRTMPPFLNRAISPKAPFVFDYGQHLTGAYMLKRCLYMPEELDNFLNPDVVQEGLRELDTIAAIDDSVAGIKSNFRRMVALETKWYLQNRLLRDTDWASMAHSLEVRTPLVDKEVYIGAMQQIAGEGIKGKRQLTTAVLKQLPESITERKKTGFSIPINKWLNQSELQGVGMRQWAQEIGIFFGLEGLMNRR